MHPATLVSTRHSNEDLFQDFTSFSGTLVMKGWGPKSQWMDDGGCFHGRPVRSGTTARRGMQGGSLHVAMLTLDKDCVTGKLKASTRRNIDINPSFRGWRTGLLPSYRLTINGRAVPSTFACGASEAHARQKEHFKRGRIAVRPIDKENKEEIASVVRLQSDGFHTPHPIPFLDSTFKRFFAAEVLSEMNKKIKYNPAERFVCLVAIDEVSNSVVGVVDVSYLDEKEVLRILGPGVDGFVYIASMTVNATWRRRGVALELLEAAKRVARQWSEGAAYLHVYQDNAAAIQLYKKHGFEIIFQDPSWLAMVGVRPRFLMRKGYM